MQRPNTRQAGPLQTPTPSFPSSPFSRGGKLIQPNAHENWFVAVLGCLGLCWPISGDYVGPTWFAFYVGPSWPCVGLSWGHGTMLGPCWGLLGRLGPMLAHVGTMLGVPGFYVWTSWLCVGLSLGHVAPSWDYVERRKDIKVQKLYENMFPSQFFTVFAVFFTRSTF